MDIIVSQDLYALSTEELPFLDNYTERCQMCGGDNDHGSQCMRNSDEQDYF